MSGETKSDLRKFVPQDDSALTDHHFGHGSEDLPPWRVFDSYFDYEEDCHARGISVRYSQHIFDLNKKSGAV